MTKILKITFSNYMPFYKDVQVEFSADSRKNFNVVSAGTGGGKTTILDAITWCLYGLQLHKPVPVKRLLNDKRKDELKVGDLEDVSVEIVLGDSPTNIDYVFRRRLSFVVEQDGTVSPVTHSMEFTAKIKDARNNLIDAPDPAVAVEWIFPREIQHLFIFDGEHLQKFFDEDNISKTKKAITDITQIDFLETAIRHLKSFSASYRTDDSSNPKIKELDKTILAASMRLEAWNEEKTIAQGKLEEAKQRHQEYFDKLKGKESARAAIEEEEQLNGRISAEEDRLRTLEADAFRHLLESVPVLFCKTQLTNTSRIIDEKYEKGELPANIKVDFCEKLLSKKICICGTKLEKNSKARQLVEEYLGKAPLSKYEGEIRHGQQSVQLLINESNSFFKNRREFFEKIGACNSNLRDFNERISKIREQAKGASKSELESLYSQKDFHFAEIQKYNKEIGALEANISTKINNIEYLEKQKRRFEGESIKNDELRQKFSICDSAINFLVEIKDTLLSEMKVDIEQETDKLLKQALVDEPRIARVNITDEFECQVLDRGNENIYASLSSGQKQALATSFMIALRKEAGFDSPILIDYPFGRIDPKKRLELIDALKRILTDVQVNFFLIEGGEFTPWEERAMKDRIGSHYKIIKDDLHSVVERVK